jgi:hypothetical protein
MMIPLTTYPPDRPHEVIEVVAAVGVSTKGFLSAPDLGVAMAACRDGLRLNVTALINATPLKAWSAVTAGARSHSGTRASICPVSRSWRSVAFRSACSIS